MRASFAHPLALALAASVGCGKGVASLPVDAGDGGSGLGLGSIQGVVFADFCNGLPDASVSVVGTSIQATTDGTGAFSLSQVPLPATLVVAGPGMTPTRTAEVGASGAIEAFVVPTSIVSEFFLLAGQSADPTRGVVEVNFVNGHQLPVAGAAVSLTDQNGHAAGTPNYVTNQTLGDGEVIPAFDPSATQTAAGSGAAVFFSIAPGRYQAGVSRTGYSVPAQTIDVEAGSLTVLRFVGSGTDGTAPAHVFGTVSLGPLMPAYGPAVPSAGIGVTLTTADGGQQVATSDSAGGFTFDLPDARQEVDLTFEKAGTFPVRSNLFCVGSTYHFTSALNDVFWTEQVVRQALIAGSINPTRGHVIVGLDTGTPGTYAPGVHVAVSPQGQPFYGAGTPHATLDPCDVGSCAGKGTCPAGARCDGDQVCRVGQDPLCQACASTGTTCPTGSLPADYSDGAAQGPCFCAPTLADCTSQVCPANTACQYLVSLSSGASGTATLQGPVCFPDFSPPTSSVDQPIVVPNLAPGVYTLTADDGRPPLRARVSAGIEVSAGWSASAAY